MVARKKCERLFWHRHVLAVTQVPQALGFELVGAYLLERVTRFTLSRMCCRSVPATRKRVLC